MCVGLENSEEQFNATPKFRLADFFESHWEDYLKEDGVRVSLEQFKAVSSMRVCRTAALGIDHYFCPTCGEEKEIYHNCRHRFCPTCSWGDTIKWADKISSQMMSLAHRHVVFTLPHAFIPLIKRNGSLLLNLLLRMAGETMKDWLGYKYQVKIGIISVLHTYGEKKDYHPHVHMIVSWGGIDTVSGQLKTIENPYANREYLQAKFRGKFEEALINLYEQGELSHTYKDRLSFQRFLRQVNKKNWSIHLEPPMAAPSAVIRYIGRYSKRACLSERKITQIEGDYISFRYKDYKVIGLDKKPVERELSMHYREFIPTLLQHVPLRYFRMVRYYGVYSNKGYVPEEYRNTEKIEEEQVWESPFECNLCKEERVYGYTEIDIRKRIFRTEPYDRRYHSHHIFKRTG